MSAEKKRLISSVLWNLVLLLAGSVVCAIGINSIIIPKGFITGGLSGVCLLLYYVTGILSPGLWYFIINIPVFVVGWILVSRRFFFYSLYGMIVFSITLEAVTFNIDIQDPFLAILAGGSILGIGSGIALHSLGSLGGMDIISIILNQKFGIRIGTFLFGFNMLLFAFSFGTLDTDLVLYSIALSFVFSQVLDHFLTMFNQRKMVLVVSKFNDQIAAMINLRLNRGGTFLHGTGAYSGESKKILLTVVHNYQLKRLEEVVFSIDADAFVITENTFNVLGRGFSKAKKY
ncbi:MAG: YitT family protein [Desulfamplus sp.]|nr:YitT family protein [Desulfamplus sp.]